MSMSLYSILFLSLLSTSVMAESFQVADNFDCTTRIQTLQKNKKKKNVKHTFSFSLKNITSSKQISYIPSEEDESEVVVKSPANSDLNSLAENGSLSVDQKTQVITLNGDGAGCVLLEMKLTSESAYQLGTLNLEDKGCSIAGITQEVPVTCTRQTTYPLNK